MLLGLMKAPITNLALISKEIPSSMVRTLSAYGDSKIEFDLLYRS